jgi:hypothetical protein
MSPKAERNPASSPQQFIGLGVALSVPGQFRAPVVGVRLRVIAVIRAGVPEAAIDKNRDPRAWENEIGRAAVFEEGPTSNEIAQAEGEGCSAHGKLWLRVPRSIALHDPPASRRRRP